MHFFDFVHHIVPKLAALSWSGTKHPSIKLIVLRRSAGLDLARGPWFALSFTEDSVEHRLVVYRTYLGAFRIVLDGAEVESEEVTIQLVGAKVKLKLCFIQDGKPLDYRFEARLRSPMK